MTLRDRLIGGAVDGLMLAIDTITSFWQTPREVEWAKAAADGLAEREAEEEVAAPRIEPRCTNCDTRLGPVAAKSQIVEGMFCSVRCVSVAEVRDAIKTMRAETSAPTPGAVDGPAEGEPPEPSAGVGPNSPKWLRDLIEATEDYVGAPRGSLSSPLESVDHAAASVAAYARGEYPPIADVPGLRWRDCAHSAEVEPPASAPSVESPAPEFDWVTTAIPVIAGVLAEHVPSPQCNYILCLNGQLETCGEFDNWADWRNHIAPHIAVDIQSNCLTTSYDFPSGDRPRPLADFPKHQK